MNKLLAPGVGLSWRFLITEVYEDFTSSWNSLHKNYQPMYNRIQTIPVNTYMANWTSNTLTVSCEKKYKNELQRFVEAVNDVETIVKKDLNKMHKQYLAKHKQKYVDNKDLTQFVKHSTMRPVNFFMQILDYKLNDDGSVSIGSLMSMQKILPCPEELLNVTCPVRAENGESQKEFKARVKRCKKQYGSEDWYHWNCNHYGTKWDVDATIESQSSNEIVYQFDSANGTVDSFIEIISPKFPNLRFILEYEGEGGEYAGELDMTNGEGSSVPVEPKTKFCETCGNRLDEDGNCDDCNE